jgi:hypothetical protein
MTSSLVLAAVIVSCIQGFRSFSPVGRPRLFSFETDDSRRTLRHEVGMFHSDQKRRKGGDDLPDYTHETDITASASTKASRLSKPLQEDSDDNEWYHDDQGANVITRTKTHSVRTVKPSASWMDRNVEFEGVSNEKRDKLPRTNRFKKQPDDDDNSQPPATFRQDFRGTRVFVQNLPSKVSWQDLKDHFRIAGEVIFASVSIDPSTGASKGCGVVQFESTEQAKKAIQIMRDHPLGGNELYVREDVQEKPGRELQSNYTKQPRGPTPPTKWKCANEDNASYLSEQERKLILQLVKERDFARRGKRYGASDDIRDELKATYGVHVDDRLHMWWTDTTGKNVPKIIQDRKGDGRWGDEKAWRQIPTSPENDACVNPDLVNGLLKQRDIARREKDFKTADALLEQARQSPDGELNLRIHDESRTWRIWTEEKPPSSVLHNSSPGQQCLAIVREFAPERVDEVKMLLEKFTGREWDLLKKLKQRYNA